MCDWIQVTPDVTLNNVTLLNNLLLNSYFENPTVKLHILYVFNMHANFHANRITFQFTNSFFMHYFKLQKLEFKLLIDDIAINFLLS